VAVFTKPKPDGSPQTGRRPPARAGKAWFLSENRRALGPRTISQGRIIHNRPRLRRQSLGRGKKHPLTRSGCENRTEQSSTSDFLAGGIVRLLARHAGDKAKIHAWRERLSCPSFERYPSAVKSATRLCGFPRRDHPTSRLRCEEPSFRLSHSTWSSPDYSCASRSNGPYVTRGVADFLKPCEVTIDRRMSTRVLRRPLRAGTHRPSPRRASPRPGPTPRRQEWSGTPVSAAPGLSAAPARTPLPARRRINGNVAHGGGSRAGQFAKKRDRPPPGLDVAAEANARGRRGRNPPVVPKGARSRAVRPDAQRTAGLSGSLAPEVDQHGVAPRSRFFRAPAAALAARP